MFGLIAAGRMVQTNFVPVDETKCVIEIPNTNEINHIVVFLTGAQAFPVGYGGQIYFNLPDRTTREANWSLLGHITNTKPSAIFKLSNLKTTDQVNPVSSTYFGQPTSQFGNESLVAQIGISIEPLATIEGSTPVTASAVSNVTSFMEFSNKMLENFFNYASSFNTGNGNEYVPLHLIKSWYDNFQRRLQANPYFWRT